MMKTEQERINEALKQVEIKKKLMDDKQKEIDELDKRSRKINRLRQELARLQADYYNAINIYNIIR